ncbi:amidophosphoribosyltransferase [Clostridium aestuarii]|uniref:Amidophosphoribosyltransferase n=1 Tax=Clostridium aestuarii TaxID=338193 RepID=A0ABT4D3I6_9CLOT|nr:amidophosphoribosyltransferase [Clostridium aestuarii]MCY6485809.1 amidophosphoribosyltransferase [Clostridium aestuarii]
MKDIDKFEEECGVFGVFSKEEIDISHLTYYGLFALQHRGQESAGIAISNKKKLSCYKNMGLVADVFDEKILSSMKGNSAIGHVRYSTTGDSNVINAQPILCDFKLGKIAIAHNGNLLNISKLKEFLKDKGTAFQTTTDSEIILNLIARQADKSIEDAVISAIKVIKGSYALAILTEDKLIGVRDPNGIRPLCIGKINESYIICSESCALNSVGAKFVRDVMPGEMVVIDNEGIKSIYYSKNKKCAVCAFEYIYFAREDSIIDGIDVYLARSLAGKHLYKETPVEGDVVIGVPDSGIPAAIGYSKASGIPYQLGFIKNRYIGRTFIVPSQKIREKSVSIKLNPIKRNIAGKRVIVVDDSLVRGTTSRQIVKSLRKCGAREVHFRVASPMVKHCCELGIDIFNKKEIVGSSMKIDEIKKFIGADSLGYLSIDGLLKVFEKNEGFCLGCFNGNYPVK